MKKPRENKLKQPSGLYLTQRDRQILYTIHQYDGLMTLQQIRTLFFDSQRTAYGRMLKLFKFGYVDHPGMKIRMSLDEMVYWLKPEGAKIAAEVEGTPIEHFKWVKKPRMDRLPHHNPLNSFRAKLTREVEATSALQLINWTGQFSFAQHTDQVEYRNTFGKAVKRFIEPDGLFIIHNTQTDNTLRALLEFDRGQKSGIDIVNEKVLPTIVYFASEYFSLRTGFNSGRMLFVVQSEHSELRLRYLKRAVEKAAKQYAKFFWFATHEAVMNAVSIIFDPIWVRGQQPSPQRKEQKIMDEVLHPMSLMLPD
jgi:Replication-relaxation